MNNLERRIFEVDDSFYPSVNKIFKDFFKGNFPTKSTSGDSMLLSAFDNFPKVTSYKEGGDLVIEAVLAGVPKDEVNITVKNNVLTFRYEAQKDSEEKSNEDRVYFKREIKQSSFERQFLLPDGAMTDQITAEYKYGVAKLHIPIEEPEVKTIKL